MVSPLDSLEMDAVFLSDTLDVKGFDRLCQLKESSTGFAPQCAEFAIVSPDAAVKKSVQELRLTLQFINDYSLFYGFNKEHLPPLEG